MKCCHHRRSLSADSAMLFHVHLHLTAMFVKDYWENKPYILGELGAIVSSHELPRQKLYVIVIVTSLVHTCVSCADLFNKLSSLQVQKSTKCLQNNLKWCLLFIFTTRAVCLNRNLSTRPLLFNYASPSKCSAKRLCCRKILACSSYQGLISIKLTMKI